MNLGQAVAICLYELVREGVSGENGSGEAAAGTRAFSWTGRERHRANHANAA